MKPRFLRGQVIWALFSLFLAGSAQGGTFEFSGTFSFNSSSFGNGNQQWTRRWGASVGYTFWSLSEIEFAVQDVLYRTKIARSEDTTFHDQIFSIDWVQSLTSKSSGFQPYVKAGVGQLNREASGIYDDGAASPPATYGSLTGILGAGLRIFVHRAIALRAEGATYLTGAVLSTWQDNFALNAGLSLYF
jgi:hypothetical protein